MKQFIWWIMVLVCAVVQPARAADPAADGRSIQAQYQAAVVTVKLVVNYSISFAGRDQHNESKTEAVGVVIDPSGLTVISLTAIDPGALVKSQMRGAPREMQIDGEVKDAKLILADNTEIPAQVVLRDKDLDVAFLRPTEKPARPLVAIDLSKAAQPALLDEVVCLNRLGQVANRVVAVSIERVDALVDRPRPFYVLSPGGSSGIGSPVFAVSGAPLGILLIRHAPSEGEANLASLFSSHSGSLGFMPIVVPAADLLDDVRQALEAKKP